MFYLLISKTWSINVDITAEASCMLSFWHNTYWPFLDWESPIRQLIILALKFKLMSTDKNHYVCAKAF